MVPVANQCRPCPDGTYESHPGLCTPKIQQACGGSWVSMGPALDDVCLPIMTPCENMVHVPSGSSSSSGGLVCLRLTSLAGRSLGFADDHDLWYRSCGPSPRFSEWSAGAQQQKCTYSCLYGSTQSHAANMFDMGVAVADVCTPCARDVCPYGLTRPLSSVRIGCGPATMLALSATNTGDGCVSSCALLPTGAKFVTDLTNPCAWECIAGYINPGGTCLACGPNICQVGQLYLSEYCGPTFRLSDACVACEPYYTASVVDLMHSTPGVCAFTCQAGWLLDAASTPQHPICVACSSFTCPPGQALVCTKHTACASCTLNLPSNAIALPSQSMACNMTCKSGFVAVVGTSVATPPVILAAGVRCDPCAQWPSRACIGATCPTGQYSTTGIGSSAGSCLACPSATSCPAGFFMTGCQYGITPPVCASCPAQYLLEANPTLLNTRMWAQILILVNMQPFARPATPPGYPTCTLVCAANHAYDGTQCAPCARSLFALWNASVGGRWWPASSDTNYPWLPSRPTTAGLEQRAGLCWPCPVAVTSVFDLCDTNSSTPGTGSTPTLSLDTRAVHINIGPQIQQAPSPSGSRRRKFFQASPAGGPVLRPGVRGPRCRAKDRRAG